MSQQGNVVNGNTCVLSPSPDRLELQLDANHTHICYIQCPTFVNTLFFYKHTTHPPWQLCVCVCVSVCECANTDLPVYQVAADVGVAMAPDISLVEVVRKELHSVSHRVVGSR